MQAETNALGQILGYPVPNWTPPAIPPHEPMQGRTCRLEPLAMQHAAELWDAVSLDRNGGNWTYLPYGPFETSAEFDVWLQESIANPNMVFFAIRESRTSRAVGIASYLRIAPAAGSIEVGNLHFSPLLQRTPAATEAMFLMMQRAFELGYRRYEWKCNALNEPSRRAALRLGFTFEGIFRQATIVKGYNRDTAWFSILDSEWPALKIAFTGWLAPENFDADGQQRQALGNFIRAQRSAR